MPITGAIATAYPKKTAYVCPDCGAPVVLDQWTAVTHADHEGNPVEDSGTGFYCTNELCKWKTEPLEEDWLSFTDSKDDIMHFTTEQTNTGEVSMSNPVVYTIPAGHLKAGERYELTFQGQKFQLTKAQFNFFKFLSRIFR